jgi:hypothetical protein
VLAHAELLRLGAERQADQLRKVEDGEAEVAVARKASLRVVKSAELRSSSPNALRQWSSVKPTQV